MNSKSKYTSRKAGGGIVYACGLWAMIYLCYKYPYLPYRYWLLLLPVLPIIYLTVIYHRHLSEEKDEMWRKIITEAMAFSANATAWTCCSLFFLPVVGVPVFHAQWVFFILVAHYLIGFFFSWRRYK